MLSDRLGPSLCAADTDETLRVGLTGCGGRGRGAAVEALTAEPKTRLAALAGAFVDYVEWSVAILKKTEVGDRVTVDAEHRFAGFHAYQKLIAPAWTWCCWPHRRTFGRRI